MGAVCDTVTLRDRYANRYKNLKKENSAAAASDVDNSVDNPDAAAALPGPCTWETIQTVVRNDLWTRLTDDAKPALIEEAAQAGPPPKDLDPRILAFLARELERLGIDSEYMEHLCRVVE